MRWRLVLVGAAIGVASVAVLALPAQASQGGVYLKTGDVVCTDQSRSDTGLRFVAWVINGRGTATIRSAVAAGGPETVVWTASDTTGVDKKVTAPVPGTYFRSCVTITTHTSSTWVKMFQYGTGASSIGDIGSNTANLSPGAWSCGDSGLGPVRLTGTASAPVTWYINASDQDYAFVGAVFFAAGNTVDTIFTPGPELTGLEMCVLNSSQQRITASFELSQA